MTLVFCAGAVTSATAAPPPFFAQFGEAGSGAGQLDNPRGVAADPASGHVYVADRRNMRISEFTAWGVFVKAWGWGVLDGSAEPQVCTSESGCLKGLSGFGAGELSFPQTVAVDASGDVYVGDEGFRVQKFSPEGEFILMFGGEVDKTTNANLCTKASGDVCGIGISGSGDGQFSAEFRDNSIDAGPTGTILVGDKDRVQEFNPDGTFKSKLALPEPRVVRGLAVDPVSGDLYVIVPEVEFIWKHTASGWKTDWARVGDPAASPFPIKGSPESVATDSLGNVYASATEKQVGKQAWQQLLEFNPSGACLICQGEEFGLPTDGSGLNGLGTSSGCNVAADTLYVSRFGGGKSYVAAYGSTPDPAVCPPPPRDPDVTQQYAVSAADDGAVVRAAINPWLWADTSYYVEYGTGKCAEGGCPNSQPMPPGALLGSKGNVAVSTAGVSLTGLAPGTTYHYRFVAESGFSLAEHNGPVFGIDPDGNGPQEASFQDGLEATFTTFPAPPKLREDCPNQQFRSGPSAFLPDCRAYEMVSPLDKENGDIAVLFNLVGDKTGLFQSSEQGGKLTYSSYRAFGAPQSAPFTSQYIATRSGGGWSSEAISAPREGVSIPNEKRGLDSPYKAFSADLCNGWFLQDTGPTLTAGAPVGFTDLYRRDNCGGGGYAALNTSEPQLTKASDFWTELQGLSADGECGVFRANDQLTPEGASKADLYQLYETCGGTLRLLSVLPDGSASEMNSSAGTASGSYTFHRSQSVWRAVSEDGSRVYWTAAAKFTEAPGKIYVRENADQPQSAIGGGGECEEAAKACTYPVSETVSAADAQFLSADPTGSKALFTSAGSLYEFDFASKGSGPAIAGEVLGLLGASDDLSRVYLVSKEDLGGGAKAGSPNLYLYQRGTGLTFIATLSAFDASTINSFPSPLNKEPIRHVARVSPSGEQVAFAANASLTGYENTDANSGEADAEVYLYDATANGGAGELLCVSCNPSGARPSGRAVGQEFNGDYYWAAAKLPAWETQLYPPRVLSEDGSRLFFESFEPLVLRDTNGKQDVYEWERAAGAKECEALGAELFVATAGGCLSLISSGQGATDSEFLDANLKGTDVFFVTGASLLPQDYGLVDVYDARVGGGLPPSPVPQPPCEGEACQSPPAPPDDPTPSSSAFNGKGNATEGPAGPSKPRCGKGKHQVKRGGKTRCAPKHKHKGKGSRAGRAAR